MKKIILAIAFVFSVINVNAQFKILDKNFWITKPNLEEVKKEIKGFDFKTIQGSDDPLFLAINNDADINIIKFLADQPNVNFSRTIHEGRIYLHTAVTKNNLPATQYLIDKGSDINFIDANGHTPATFGGFNGSFSVEMLDLLYKNGLDLNKKYDNKDGANLLLLSVGYDNDLSITNYLVAKGISLQSVDRSGYNAIYHAAKIGNVDIVKYLVSKGVKPQPEALIAAAQGTYRSANKIDIYRYLIDELKLNPKIVDEQKQTLLHLVTKKQNQDEIVRYLISKGVDAKLFDNDGNTSFMNAANGKSLEIVQMLYPFNENINIVNKKGDSPIINAVKNSTGEIVEFLIKNGANVNVKDKDNKTLAYLLVESFRAPRNFGRTPQKEEKDDFKLKLTALQKKGIDFSKTFSDGNTIYHLAVEKNNLDLLKKIQGINVDINAQNNEGFTALQKAALVATNDEILKYLISLGASKQSKTDLDETAYDLARDNEELSKKNISIDFLK